MGKIFTSPFAIKGELHDVHLFNISLNPDELSPLVPRPLIPVVYKERAWASVLSVHLKNMRPAFLPFRIGLGYHHFAHRVLVDCPLKADGDHTNAGGDSAQMERGVYFLNSFTDNRFFLYAGNIMSEYNFRIAEIAERWDGERYELRCIDRENGNKIEALCNYGEEASVVSKGGSFDSVEEAKGLIGPLTRAFSVNGLSVSMVEIQRER